MVESKTFQDIDNEYSRRLKEGKESIAHKLSEVHRKHAAEVSPLHEKFSSQRAEISAERDRELRRIDDEERKQIQQIRKKFQGDRAKVSIAVAKKTEELNQEANQALQPHSEAIHAAETESAKDEKDLLSKLSEWKSREQAEIWKTQPSRGSQGSGSSETLTTPVGVGKTPKSKARVEKSV